MWVNYINGNYKVLLNLNNGTKIRYNKENTLIPNRPESIDVKITNQCEHMCLFCHESSIPSGKQASYESLEKFAKSLPPYIEISVGGGNLMLDFKHTQFFLEKLKEANAIPSITIKQEDFIKYSDIIEEWYLNNLIYGVGVSLSNPRDVELYKAMSYIPTAVIHVIAGIFDETDCAILSKRGYKLLILGFKNFRRGRSYYNGFKQKIDKNIQWLHDNINDVINNFSVVAFDNLAIKQLYIKELLTEEQWNSFYMGDDGIYTFYVDLVEKTYARNSTAIARFGIKDFNIKQMFLDISKIKEVGDMYDSN